MLSSGPGPRSTPKAGVQELRLLSHVRPLLAWARPSRGGTGRSFRPVASLGEAGHPFSWKVLGRGVECGVVGLQGWVKGGRGERGMLITSEHI